jgi:hypothetical protein
MSTIVLSPTTRGDAEQLRSFRCSTGPRYEAEVEQLIQGSLSDQVARPEGPQDLSALVADDAGQLVAVIGYRRDEPDGGTMFDQADAARTTPTRGRSRYRFGCASVVLASVALALIVAISAALLIPVPACACATPLDLVVQNYSHQNAPVSWSQPGLFGSPLRGCRGAHRPPAAGHFRRGCGVG